MATEIADFLLFSDNGAKLTQFVLAEREGVDGRTSNRV